MNFPSHLKYSKDHEWAQIDGGRVTVGITEHAQSALGDVVFVELPQIGRELKSGETFGVVESIKAVSDLYAPVSGKVVAVNTDLASNPSWINQDPYSKAWIIKLEMTDGKSANDLMDAAQYETLVKSLN